VSDRDVVALLAALTVAMVLSVRLAGATGWQRAVEDAASEMVAVPVAAMQATAHDLCAPVTTLIPIQCYRP